MTVASVDVDLVSAGGLEGYKAARVTGKLTFDVDRAGRVALADHPIPIYGDDIETPLGPLPRDTGGFAHEQVEVIVHGAAYAPGGRPTTAVQVTLQLGERALEATVTGDRVWVGDGPDARPSAPVPFTRMPMTYAQAYGGMAQVWIDEHTEFPVGHPANPLGLGFDARATAAPLCEELRAPEGFPRVTEPRRLPNLEASNQRITAWSDRPAPCCWSTRPITIPGSIDLPRDPATPASADETPPERPAWADTLERAMSARCHPALLLDEAPPSIGLRGMTPEGYLAFPIPTIELAVDYHVDGRTGTRPLRLRRILALPEERRFACTYQTRFKFRASVGGERSLRVRLDA